ncbi:MAG: hypothetical protein SF029_26455 [bacterium]|nr:hypothetical protein [bacterium]
MRFRVSWPGLIGSVLVLFTAACQGQRPIEYQVLITQEVTRVVTVVVTAPPSDSITPATTPPPVSPSGIATTLPPAPPQIAAQSTDSGPVPTVNPCPTPVQNQVIVAEQAFQTGRMFYLQPQDEIWVLLNDGDGDSGTWLIEEDTFEDGMPMFDPNIQVPEGLFQPESGFGKLWRENERIRNGLGFATNTEAGHVTNYTYTFGGSVNAAGECEVAPGVHTLLSREGVTFAFDETSMMWSLIQ